MNKQKILDSVERINTMIESYTVLRDERIKLDIQAQLKQIKTAIGGITMSDEDGKGPRKRSRYPSKPKGGRRKGPCK